MAGAVPWSCAASRSRGAPPPALSPVLELLAPTDVPAPGPVLLDVEGRYFGTPAMVIEHSGSPLMEPRNEASWLRQMAEAISLVHRVTPENADLGFLSEPLPRHPATEAREPDPLIDEAKALLREFEHRIDPLPPTLVDDDYWPGNTTWKRQRMTAIIDWDGAIVGDPRTDIAQCRMDLTLIKGPDAAAQFLRAYESLAGAPLADLWYFDLVCALDAFEWHRAWLRGYLDIGITGVTPETMEAGVRGFIAGALERGRQATT